MRVFVYLIWFAYLKDVQKYLTSIDKTERPNEPRRVAEQAVCVELEHQAGSRAVEHMWNIGVATTEQPWPGGVLIDLPSLQVKEQFDEVSTDTAKTYKHTSVTIIRYQSS